jgi:esterase/lipase superfamily enzyme
MRPACQILVFTLVFATSACGWRMMPAPYLYSQGCREAFLDLPGALQVSQLDVLYATDREPEPGEGDPRYGHGRSRSLAFGRATVALDPALEWPDVVAYTAGERDAPSAPRFTLDTVTEIARFPATPYGSRWDGAKAVVSKETVLSHERAAESTSRTLREYLARTPRKQVFLIVHGISRSFEHAIFASAEAWHFLGREGVPIAYTWPARVRSLGLSYAHDRESGEFTIYHLKQLIEQLASIPEIESINILAHSRGTDVVLTALRELFIQRSAQGPEHVAALRIGKVALIAADLDLEVASQRIAAEAMGPVAERMTAYVYASDWALFAAGTIFRGRSRIGNVSPEALDDGERERIAGMGNVDFVAYRGSKGGSFGHFYFRDSPAVSSDVMLWMRYGLLPGAEHGRPLAPEGESLWSLGDDYQGGRPPCH